MTRDELVALPKVELHCHLDGSLSRNFIEKRLGRKILQEELSVSDDCRSLNEYLEKFDLPGQCLMDEEGLREAGYDVLRSMYQENVCYAEVRFAPLCHASSQRRGESADAPNCQRIPGRRCLCSRSGWGRGTVSHV